jgi:hypothetical protein
MLRKKKNPQGDDSYLLRKFAAVKTRDNESCKSKKRERFKTSYIAAFE